MKIYYDKDADLSLLKKKKIAVIGYGSQGHAQSQNLKHSKMNVVVSEVSGSKAWKRAGRTRPFISIPRPAANTRWARPRATPRASGPPPNPRSSRTGYWCWRPSHE